ncbi:hypothetical protein C8R45DRAFT_1070165 [Mycena sanguinolenta]|nr:hypothetical protein C8R45DRAFT_1070165 [Mycena sanguinolenta]
MEARGPLRRLFSFLQKKPPKDVDDSGESSTTTRLTWDAIRTALDLAKEAADVCPPLKSAVGGVVALCNLAERLSACDENVKMLVWRSVTILDTIYRATDPDTDATIPVHYLEGILRFETSINEIRTAMEAITTRRKNRVLRVLHLRRNESQLAKFTARLDSAAEVFAIHSMTVQTMALARIETVQTMSLARIEDKVEVVASTVEHSNISLRNRMEILQLQVAVVFLA